MKQRLKNGLEVSGNIATVVICVALLFSMSRQYFGNSRGSRPPGLSTGEIMPNVPGVSYTQTRGTILLFLSPTCIACIQSIADYAELRRFVDSAKGGIQIFGVFGTGSKEDLAAYQHLGFPFSMKQVKDLDTYRIGGTPTIVVINKQGKIANVWVGKVNSIKNIEDSIKAVINAD